MIPQNLNIKEKISERVSLIVYCDHDVIILDYTALNDREMIVTFNQALDFALNNQKEVRVISVFNKNYFTRKYINHIEGELVKVEGLIRKNVVCGLTDVQHWILMGVNLWTKRKIKNFNSFQDALDYAVNDAD